MDNLELLKVDDDSKVLEIKKQLELQDMIQRQILAKDLEIKVLKGEAEISKQDLLNNMIKYDIKSLDLGHFKVTRIDEAIRVSFDGKLLKEEDPDTYNKYTKKTKVKPYLKFTINKQIGVDNNVTREQAKELQ